MNVVDTAAQALRRAWSGDGAAVVRAVLDATTCAQLTEAIDRTRATPSGHYAQLSPAGEAVVDSDLFRWFDDQTIASVVLRGPLPSLAAAILDTTAVVFVEDQWLASAPGACTASPWHQDAPYYNIDGDFVTLWVALDEVGADAALRVVEGSQRGPTFAPVEFATTMATIGDDAGERGVRPPTDPEADGATVLAWSMAPGDVIALHSNVLHSAGGAPVGGRWFRRLSVRYARPDARYFDRGPAAASFWRSLPHGRRSGDLLACETFPLVDVTG